MSLAEPLDNNFFTTKKSSTLFSSWTCQCYDREVISQVTVRENSEMRNSRLWVTVHDLGFFILCILRTKTWTSSFFGYRGSVIVSDLTHSQDGAETEHSLLNLVKHEDYAYIDTWCVVSVIGFHTEPKSSYYKRDHPHCTFITLFDNKMDSSEGNDMFELEQSTQHLKDFKLAIEFKYLVRNKISWHLNSEDHCRRYRNILPFVQSSSHFL